MCWELILSQVVPKSKPYVCGSHPDGTFVTQLVRWSHTPTMAEMNSHKKKGWSDLFVQRENLPLVNFCLHRGYVFSPSFSNKFKSSLLTSPYSYYIEQCYRRAVKNSFSLNCNIFWIHKCTYPFSFFGHDW